MLELKPYPKSELTAMFGTRDTQSLKRKLERYGVIADISGRGNNAVFTVREIKQPFKLFCITELGISAQTDFQKLKHFYYHFFNDDEFMAMPDEVKEHRMDGFGNHVSRQTIASYTRYLARNELISWSTSDFIYYFAYKHTQRITDRKEYRQAWREYWQNKDDGMDSMEAIFEMRAKYGGIARKQAKIDINGIYLTQIEQMQTLIQNELENDLDSKIKSDI